MEDKTRDQLTLFIQKVELLKTKGFSNFCLENGLSVKANFPGIVETNLPNRDQVDSSVVTLRMFFQKNDQVSLFRISELIDNDDGLPESFKKSFSLQRQDFNDYLDRNPEIGIAKPDQPTTRNTSPGKPIFDDSMPLCYSNREIFDIFLYGEIAHTNSKKSLIYQSWEKSPFFATVEQTFAGIMMDAILCLCKMSELFQGTITEESRTIK